MAVSRVFGRRRVSIVAATAMLLLGVPIASVAVGATAASGVGLVRNFTNPTINGPEEIAAGPDGALWFANNRNNSIGRITTSGTVTNYTGTGIADPGDGITAGRDGALWFTNTGNNSIGRVTTAGVVTNYTNPSIDNPSGITAGPDGALWFTNVGNNSIGRITTAGVVTNYTNPSIDHPQHITAGPDGALWFTNPAGSGSIGRITTTGTVSSYTGPSINGPFAITAGPDGALWFTEGDSIGRITTAGAVTTFSDGSGGPAYDIAAGPDGALWFTNPAGSNSIGRITTTGVVTNIADSSISFPLGIAAGSDGAMWFTNNDVSSIGATRVGEPVLVPGNASVVEGNSGTTTLNVPVTLSNPSTQTVTADWATLFAPGAPGNQADPSSDYTAASATVTFAPGETSKTVPISVNGDTLVEPDEYIIVAFSNPTNATIGGFYGLGFGGITNDDHATIIPGSASVLEGNSGTTNLNVPVTLSNPSTQTITAQWATEFLPGAPGNQADPSSDYTATSGTVTFAPGQTSQTITISVNGDTTVEPDEYIIIPFTHPTNATLGGFYGIGFGGITNDD